MLHYFTQNGKRWDKLGQFQFIIINQGMSRLFAADPNKKASLPEASAGKNYVNNSVSLVMLAAAAACSALDHEIAEMSRYKASASYAIYNNS